MALSNDELMLCGVPRPVEAKEMADVAAGTPCTEEDSELAVVSLSADEVTSNAEPPATVPRLSLDEVAKNDDSKLGGFTIVDVASGDETVEANRLGDEVVMRLGWMLVQLATVATGVAIKSDADAAAVGVEEVAVKLEPA